MPKLTPLQQYIVDQMKAGAELVSPRWGAVFLRVIEGKKRIDGNKMGYAQVEALRKRGLIKITRYMAGSFEAVYRLAEVGEESKPRPMTLAQAREKARAVFGSNGHVTTGSGKKWVGYVSENGNGAFVSWCGDTWEQAFADADKRQQEKEGEQ